MDSHAHLAARLAELAARGGRSRFLEPGESVALAQKAAHEAGVDVAFWGGYPGAERTVAAFYWAEPPQEFSIARLRAQWNGKYASLGHRDLLGALLGLGIEREMLGDILLCEDGARVFVLEEIAPYLLVNWDGAGRAKLHVCREEGDFSPPEPEGEYLRETVNSLRLDAILAAGYGLSREQAQRLVRQGLVKLNHVECARTDARVEAGDLISARGYGRLRVEEELGKTRKDRLAVRLFRYGR